MNTGSNRYDVSWISPHQHTSDAWNINSTWTNAVNVTSAYSGENELVNTDSGKGNVQANN